MIISVLPFELKQGRRQEFESVFDKNQILERAIRVQGCEQLFIASESGNPDKVFVVGLWEDQEAYQRWMDHPERGIGADELLELVSGGFDPAAPAEHWNVLRSLTEAGKFTNSEST